MRFQRYQWIFLLLIVILIDFGVRAWSGFDMAIVIPFEAVCFSIVSFLFFLMSGRGSRSSRLKKFEVFLSIAFCLGAVRSALWAVGIDIAVANIVVLVLAIAGAASFALWKRRSPFTS